MSEINFQSKGKKSYVVKLDDTAIGRLVKTNEGFWKISLGVLDDQDLYRTDAPEIEQRTTI